MNQPLRIKITSDERVSCVVMFEPLGVTYDLGPDEHMYAEVQSIEQQDMEIVYWPGGVSVWPPGPVKTFTANGEELDELNY